MPAPAQEITKRLTTDLPESGRIQVEDLLALAALPIVRGFLELELQIAIEADTESVTSHFKLPSSLERNVYGIISASIARLATVSVEDGRQLLAQAVKDALEYLTTPRSFLLSLLGSDVTVSLDEFFFFALSRLKEYEHFPEILKLWADRQRAEGVEEVSRTQFDKLLRDVDRGMIGHFQFDQIVELLAPLAILVRGAIPRELLVDFFRDKSMHRVAAMIASDPRPVLTVHDVQNVLHHVHSQSAELGPGNREQLLAELRAAGVVIHAQGEGHLLKDIERRHSPHSN